MSPGPVVAPEAVTAPGAVLVVDPRGVVTRSTEPGRVCRSGIVARVATNRAIGVGGAGAWVADVISDWVPVVAGVRPDTCDAPTIGGSSPTGVTAPTIVITKAGDCLGPKSTKVIACLQPDRRVEVEVIGTRIVR